eukprot:Clim_evm35s156 gene=Clim_evmTU35s156
MSETVTQIAGISVDDILASRARPRYSPKRRQKTVSDMRLTYPQSLRLRAFLLFTIGGSLCWAMHLLQLQHGITEYPEMGLLLPSTWWVLPATGLGCVFMGLAYPVLDQLVDAEPPIQRDWGTVMRSVGLFLSVGYASAKLPLVANVQLAIALTVSSLTSWYLFDRTLRGLVFNVIATIVGTVWVQIMVALGYFTYTQPDFFWVRSWFPAILFAGGICFGTLGRQLAEDLGPTVTQKPVKKD